MRKFNIKLCIVAITTAVLLAASIIIYAAFSFKKNVVSEDVTVGGVTINSKQFLSYAKKTNEAYADTPEYYRLCKLRTDSVAYVEGITINSTYQKAGSISSFAPGVTYYTYDENNNTYTIVQQSWQSGVTYYIKVDSLHVNQAYDKNNTLLSAEANGNVITLKKPSTNTVVETLTVTISGTVVTNVVLGDTTRRYVIGSDGLSVYIFEKNVGTSVVASEGNTITCYASERKKNDERIDYDAPYLNQLGLAFTFTTEIPVYVRIHIQDAWISTQFLSSKSERIRYISKDQISGVSPFTIDDPDWYYDSQANVAYYKGLFEPVIENGTYKSQSYVFNVNEGYFYHDTSAQAASKVTTVQVSFTVDIVQANRAEALWDVDFDEIFGNN